MKFIIGLLVVLGIIGGVCYAVAWSNSGATQTCTVESKDRSIQVKDGQSTTEYRAYTDCGVFTVSDDPIHGQFNSADTYGRLRPGHTYQLRSFGWRNGWASMFPNIIHAKEVTK